MRVFGRLFSRKPQFAFPTEAAGALDEEDPQDLYHRIKGSMIGFGNPSVAGHG